MLPGFSSYSQIVRHSVCQSSFKSENKFYADKIKLKNGFTFNIDELTVLNLQQTTEKITPYIHSHKVSHDTVSDRLICITSMKQFLCQTAAYTFFSIMLSYPLMLSNDA